MIINFKNFPEFYETRRFITVVTRALHWSLSRGRSIQSISSHPNSLRTLLTLSTHLRLGLPNGLLFLYLEDGNTMSLQNEDNDVAKLYGIALHKISFLILTTIKGSHTKIRSGDGPLQRGIRRICVHSVKVCVNSPLASRRGCFWSSVLLYKYPD
jgi:hypothetical protein